MFLPYFHINKDSRNAEGCKGASHLPTTVLHCPPRPHPSLMCALSPSCPPLSPFSSPPPPFPTGSWKLKEPPPRQMEETSQALELSPLPGSLFPHIWICSLHHFLRVSVKNQLLKEGDTNQCKRTPYSPFIFLFYLLSFKPLSDITSHICLVALSLK